MEECPPADCRLLFSWRIGDKGITTDAPGEQTTRATSNVCAGSRAQTLKPTFLERSVHVFVPADAEQQGGDDQGGGVPRAPLPHLVLHAAAALGCGRREVEVVREVRCGAAAAAATLRAFENVSISSRAATTEKWFRFMRRCAFN